jgi:imidazole glycerol-phosphate synthase subunit HisF
MITPRMCFVLLYSEDVFNLSRNFKLQKVGNTEWVIENYDFNEMSKSIDELIILNINKNQKPISKKFITNISPLIEKSLMPVGIGGGIKNYETAKFYFDNGADKIIINSNFFQNDTNFIQKIINQYGSQSVVASIDYKKQGLKNAEVYIDNGDKKLGISLFDAIRKIEVLGAGEILLNSIDRDGVGYGYDIETLKEVNKITSLPIIPCGGADNYHHLLEGIKTSFLYAVSTSHIFNFMGDGLKETKKLLIKEGYNFINWDYSTLKISNENK